ncbi:hypothetical protein BJ912DRAFT_261608 [Pholiota molesta]|nr:hypothetical protein BJ912DRAFT_261608 [Pholiota molesta]
MDDHFVLFFVLLSGKFYTFGMLRTLNSRKKLRQRMKSHDLGRTSLSSWQWDRTPPETGYERSEPMEPTVLVPERSLNIVTIDTRNKQQSRLQVIQNHLFLLVRVFNISTHRLWTRKRRVP